ncbi:MAG: NUDIX domain-containing protein [Candidatus Daviesbacteria bacterium]|nr:NUDIX domain-containing protein [Candidatus Daviesbacteria bacterium]
MNKNFIDKLAYIQIVNKKVLVSLSRGKDTWYIPGGKREGSEDDKTALTREVKEELTVDLIPSSITYYGTFEAQAHGKAEGVIVRMTCYTANFTGEIKPASEIDQINYFTYSQKDLTSPVDHLIFDDLEKRKLIK